MKFWKFLLLTFFLPSLLFSEDIFTLSGSPQQGGLLFGKISAQIEYVFFNYQPVKIHENNFLLGFDRDEKLNHIISFVLNDGKIISQRFSIKKRNYRIEEITLPKSKKSYFSRADEKLLIRINAEANKLKTARTLMLKNDNLLINNNFTRAVDGGRVSGLFGSQRIINGVTKKPHNGLDIAAPTGTAVLAMNAGRVALTGDFYYNGKFVLIDHGAGLSSIYIHLSEISVSSGDSIKTGDKIGAIGNTGRSTGPHLHWGINYYKKRIDPALLKNMDDFFIRFRDERLK